MWEMENTSKRGLYALLVFTWMVTAPGCANGPLKDNPLKNSVMFGWLPDRKDDPDDLDRFGPIPSVEIAQLRELSDAINRTAPDVQQRLSVDLANRVTSEQDPLIRAEVVRTLGALKTATAAQGLQNALADGVPDVRIVACEAWRRRGGPESITALASVVGSDTDLDVRLAATRALRGSRDPRALQALSVALDDADVALQYRAIESLREVSPHDYGGDVGAWRQFAQGGTPPPPEPVSLAQRLRDWF